MALLLPGRYSTSSRGLCSGVLFIDLAQAYHRLVRSLSVGLGDKSLRDLDACTAALDPAARLAFAQKAVGPSLLEELFDGQATLLLLQEIYVDTFFHLRRDVGQLTKTGRGSRPGSPSVVH